MLGQSISDPTGAEQKGTVRGMGLLPVTTVFEQEKRRTRVSGRFAKVGGALAEMSGVCYEGYEIHMGRTVLSKGTERRAIMYMAVICMGFSICLKRSKHFWRQF